MGRSYRRDRYITNTIVSPHWQLSLYQGQFPDPLLYYPEQPGTINLTLSLCLIYLPPGRPVNMIDVVVSTQDIVCFNLFRLDQRLNVAAIQICQKASIYKVLFPSLNTNPIWPQPPACNVLPVILPNFLSKFLRHLHRSFSYI